MDVTRGAADGRTDGGLARPAADGGQDAALDAVAVLADPVRRALYRYVAAAGREVGRAEAAEAVGVQRTLAAHHLDKLAEAGLVDVAFARPAGRGGPGAGRPAKVYRPAPGEVSVSVPRRAYDAAGMVLAEALERLRADDAVARAGREEGYAAGLPFRGRGAAGGPGSVAEQGVRLAEALRARGYEPEQVPGAPGAPDGVGEQGGAGDTYGGGAAAPVTAAPPPSGPSGPVPSAPPPSLAAPSAATSSAAPRTGPLRLRNCPFHRLAEQFPPLVCGMNLALLEGLVDGADTPAWRPRIAPSGDGCCVVLEPVPPSS
ncbi:helix-turn-helix transcriptional regulator [Yinghuangia sp. YIM S09857]|uniref:helix-turn-helix transcriptional regulator n=1 Tax=Yinghuangia sp. YIM S09857 TaxID=3436929 RepID=UPI003F52FE20